MSSGESRRHLKRANIEKLAGHHIVSHRIKGQLKNQAARQRESEVEAEWTYRVTCCKAIKTVSWGRARQAW